jgi:large subunit ribosomal protein L18
VRRTNTKTIVQVAEYRLGGDRILAHATSKELEGMGWSASSKSVPAAYLTGLLAARRAVAAGVGGAVLDSGLLKPSLGGKVYSALRGALDGGLEVPHSEEIFPSEDRRSGQHLGEGVSELFDKVKSKIMEGS